MKFIIHLSVVYLLLAGLIKADTIELMNGNSVEGKVLSVDAATRTVSVEAMIGGQKITRKLPQSQVHALTVDGKRTELTPKAAAATASKSRTPAEVQAVINQAGSRPPDWFATTTLNFPKTLDLTWSPPPNGKWNNQQNVGQFTWDIINPNESRWREGIKFMDHVQSLNKNNAEIHVRAIRELGNMYFRFFQDYERAAWWWQKAGVTEKESAASVLLAECYWRLGSRQMAFDLMKDPNGYLNSIKLLGDMSEPDKAIAMAERYVKDMEEPQEALILAGDACRINGRYDAALAYYERLLQTPVDPKRAGRFTRLTNRAKASIEAIKLFDTLNLAKVADGTHHSSSIGYEGAVHIDVAVKAGRIESVKVAQHKEKQYYSSMHDVPAQIIAKQGVKGVEATSRATITGNAIINATAKALAEGSR